MELLLYSIIFCLSLIFYRLVTTNHWNTGKKILVGLVFALLIQNIGFIVLVPLLMANYVMFLISEAPLLCVLACMAYKFYNKEC